MGRSYVERMGLTRTPSPPAQPSNLDGRYAYGQNDPGIGQKNPGDGLQLGGLYGITVSIWANPGLTITGGNMQCWIYWPFIGQWARCPDLDFSVTSGTYTGPGGYIFKPQKVQNRMGQLINYLSSSITGTTNDILVRIDGFTSILGMSS